MKKSPYRLCCWLFVCLPWGLHAETKTLDQWIKHYADSGTSLFYSSDFLTAEKLNQPIDLKQTDVAAFNLALNALGLQLNQVNMGEQTYVIRPIQAIPSHTILIHAVDANSNNKIKKFSIQWPEDKQLFSQNGAIVLTQLSNNVFLTTILAAGYYPEPIKSNLTKGQTLSLRVQLKPLPLALSDIQVSTSSINFNTSQNSQQSLSRQELANQVVFNHDPLRATERLAGSASNGINGKGHTRGGNENEALVLFDGRELRNPYHFKDFFSLFSTINDSVVDSIEYYSGVFPVQYGGRLSSVLDVQSSEFADLPSHDINLGLLTSSYTYRRQNDAQTNYYMLAVRTGGQLIDDHLIADLSINPEFDDGYFKAAQTLNDHWQMSQHLLASRDEISIDRNDEVAQAYAHDQNLWLQWHYDDFQQHQMSWQLYGSRRHDRRRGSLSDENSNAQVIEEIVSNFQGIKFQHQWQFNDNFLLDYGLDIATEVTRIESARFIQHSSELVNSLELNRNINRQFDFEQHGISAQIYANARYQFNRHWTLDLGVHYQNQEWISGAGISPRFNLAYFADENTTWRLGIGRHQQTQHIDELLLEDDQPQYFKPASADLAVLEFNRQFSNGWHLRSEVYYKKYSRTHPYYENIFNDFHVLPDLFYDRIRVAPDDAESAGAELTLKGKHKTIDWSASYTYSDVKDQFEQRYIPRSWNQRNAFKFHLGFPFKSWHINLNADIHNGWPLTQITATENGFSISERNQATFKDFYQLGIKLNKTWQSQLGLWQFELQIANALNTENPCCRNYQLNEGVLSFEEKYSLPIVPNMRFGLSWD